MKKSNIIFLIIAIVLILIGAKARPNYWTGVYLGYVLARAFHSFFKED